MFWLPFLFTSIGAVLSKNFCIFLFFELPNSDRYVLDNKQYAERGKILLSIALHAAGHAALNLAIWTECTLVPRMTMTTNKKRKGRKSNVEMEEDELEGMFGNVDDAQYEEETILARVAKIMHFSKSFTTKLLQKSFAKDFYKNLLQKSFTKNVYKRVFQKSFPKEFYKKSFTKEFSKRVLKTKPKRLRQKKRL